MASVIQNTIRIDSNILNRLSRLYEAGNSINDISVELKMDNQTVKRLLGLLGYCKLEWV